MSCDLVEQISAQEDAISKAFSGFHSISDGRLDLWNEFRKHIWGKGEEAFQRIELVKRDTSDPVDDVELPDQHLVATSPPGLSGLWDLNLSQFLVRSEYTEAEQAAVSMCGFSDRDMTVVTGRPGSGKSVFLLWLLMHRLSLQLPTALQICTSYAILFHKDGVSEFTDLDLGVFYRHLSFRDHPSRRIWVLIDSGPNLLEPAPIFKRASFFFAVNAVSPRSHHFSWSKKIGFENFYMKSWSGFEILQARSFFGKDLTERQVWYLYEQFGASPRVLAQYSRDPVQYEQVVLSEINKLNSTHDHDLSHAFRQPEAYGLLDHIMTIGPSPVDRNTSVTDIASQRVFKLLWKKCIQPWASTNQAYSDLLWARAGLVFKNRMHQILTWPQPVKLFPMHGYSDPADANFVYNTCDFSNPLNLWSPKLTERRLGVEGVGAPLEDSMYYLPDSENFPSIHSLVLNYPPGETSPILLMFHFALNEGYHTANLSDLDKIDVWNTPPNTPRYLVVVITPEATHLQIRVPIKYVADKDFSVFQWCVDTEDLKGVR